MESVNFQISAIGVALLPDKRPLWHLWDKARFSQQPAVPNHGLGSIPVAALHTHPICMPHTGTRPVYSDGEPQRADIWPSDLDAQVIHDMTVYSHRQQKCNPPVPHTVRHTHDRKLAISECQCANRSCFYVSTVTHQSANAI